MARYIAEYAARRHAHAVERSPACPPTMFHAFQHIHIHAVTPVTAAITTVLLRLTICSSPGNTAEYIMATNAILRRFITWPSWLIHTNEGIVRLYRSSPSVHTTQHNSHTNAANTAADAMPLHTYSIPIATAEGGIHTNGTWRL